MKGQSGVTKGITKKRSVPKASAAGATQPVVILSGLQQVEEGGSGRTLPLAFCSEGQACVPATFFFVDEFLSGQQVFCSNCEAKHDSITLLEALQRGRLILSTDDVSEEDSEYYGMAVKIRDLVRNAVRWTRSAEPPRPKLVDAPSATARPSRAQRAS